MTSMANMKSSKSSREFMAGAQVHRNYEQMEAPKEQSQEGTPTTHHPPMPSIRQLSMDTDTSKNETNPSNKSSMGIMMTNPKGDTDDEFKFKDDCWEESRNTGVTNNKLMEAHLPKANSGGKEMDDLPRTNTCETPSTSTSPSGRIIDLSIFRTNQEGSTTESNDSAMESILEGTTTPTDAMN